MVAWVGLPPFIRMVSYQLSEKTRGTTVSLIMLPLVTSTLARGLVKMADSENNVFEAIVWRR